LYLLIKALFYLIYWFLWTKACDCLFLIIKSQINLKQLGFQILIIILL